MDSDVIVIGAGPAGCTAARVCAAAGLDVLLLDRASFPRDKPCAGALSPRAVADLCRVFGLDGLPPEFGIPRRSLRAHYYRFPRGLGSAAGPEAAAKPSWLDYRRLAMPGERILAYLTRRSALDGFLAERAGEAGAVVRTRTEVVRVEQLEGEGVLVTVREARESPAAPRPTLLRPLRARFAIGADGAASVVARCLGRPPREGPVADCLNLFVPLEAGRAAALTAGAFDFHFGLVRGGYAWAFPAEEGLAVGAGALVGSKAGGARAPAGPQRNGGGREKLAAAVAWVLSVYGLPAHPDGAGRPQAWLVPLGGHRRLWARGRILLAGDAAGTASPLTGEGIGPAVASGELAARAVVLGCQAEEAGAVVAGRMEAAGRRATGARLAAALGLGGAAEAGGPAGYERSLWTSRVAGQRPLLLAARAMAVFPAAGQARLFGRPAFTRLAAMMAEEGPR